MITVHRSYRQKDRQTTYHGNTALRYASRGKKMAGWLTVYPAKSWDPGVRAYELSVNKIYPMLTDDG